MIKVNASGVIFNKVMLSLYDITYRVEKDNLVIICGNDNDRLLNVCRLTFPADTLISVDGAPVVSLGSATVAPRVIRGDDATHKCARVLKGAPEPAPEMMNVIIDGQMKVVPKVVPTKTVAEPVRVSTKYMNYNNTAAADLFMTAWRLGGRFPWESMELFKEAEKNASDSFEKEAYKLAQDICKELYKL